MAEIKAATKRHKSDVSRLLDLLQSIQFISGQDVVLKVLLPAGYHHFRYFEMMYCMFYC